MAVVDIDLGRDLNGVVVEGYDPLYVAFMDETSARSYSTSAWEYDFGDEIVYGVLPEERTEESGSDLIGKMGLPGDKELLARVLNAGSDGWLNGTGRDSFDASNIMNPKMIIGWSPGTPVPSDYSKTRFITYPSASDVAGVAGDFSRGIRHVTSYSFAASDGGANDYGNCSGYQEIPVSSPDAWQFCVSGDDGVWRFIDSGLSAEENAMLFRRSASGAKIRVRARGSEDCTRGGLCELNVGDGSTVGHLYKGPGVYTATLRQRSTSPEATYGQIPGEEDFERKGFEYAIGTIIVHPSCPCVEAHVLSSSEYGTGNRRCAVLSSENYSADNPGFYGTVINRGGTTYNQTAEWIDEAPEVFSLFDENGETIFNGISGYAPFVMASTKVSIRQSSMPVSGIRIETGDWSSDTTELSAYTQDVYLSGWPVWKPQLPEGNDKQVAWEDGKLCATVTHTYVMPGIYKPSVFLSYNSKRTPSAFSHELDDCDFPMTPMVMVKEIFPKDSRITKRSHPSTSGSTVMEFTFSAVAGSYPIADVVWNFDDGTKEFKLSRNVSAGYDAGMLVGDHTSAYYTGPSKVGYYVGGSLDVGALDWNSASSIQSRGTYVYPSGTYAEFDPRDWTVYHEYTRTCVEDRYQYVVSAMGYVCNTNTMTLATCVTTSGDIPMPNFKDTEGEVKLIDARTFDDSDDLVVTLEGDNGKRTTLYNLKWEGDNRQ